jgi:hypothetical protein
MSLQELYIRLKQYSYPNLDILIENQHSIYNEMRLELLEWLIKK